MMRKDTTKKKYNKKKQEKMSIKYIFIPVVGIVRFKKY